MNATHPTNRGFRGFTLVELLVVMSIFLLLSAIALPTVRTLLSDQKVSKSASSISEYFNIARNRAIAEGRYVGVRIERLTNSKSLEYGTAASIRLRQLVGVPPYSGEAANAKVTITGIASGIAELEFDAADNQLLTLYDRTHPPIQNRDLIELPGGKKYHLTFISNATTGDPFVRARIDLNAPSNGAIATETFPLGHLTTSGRKLKYNIQRAPVASSSATLAFPRGVALDLNYSGFGASGSQFAPTEITTVPPLDINDPIDILFGPSGSVEFISVDNLGTVGSPTGLIFLCLGESDGVIPDDPLTTTVNELFSTEKRATANVMSLKSAWIVINPTTGRTTVAPFASVATTTSIPTALLEARSLALLSDTLETE